LHLLVYLLECVQNKSLFTHLQINCFFFERAILKEIQVISSNEAAQFLGYLQRLYRDAAKSAEHKIHPTRSTRPGRHILFRTMHTATENLGRLQQCTNWWVYIIYSLNFAIGFSDKVLIFYKILEFVSYKTE
jgi:hypothetical protein